MYICVLSIMSNANDYYQMLLLLLLLVSLSLPPACRQHTFCSSCKTMIDRSTMKYTLTNLQYFSVAKRINSRTSRSPLVPQGTTTFLSPKLTISFIGDRVRDSGGGDDDDLRSVRSDRALLQS